MAHVLKQLRIKTGACRRLKKEHLFYVDELKDNERKLATMKKEGKDKYDVKKMGEIVEESERMVPDSLRRLREMWEDLSVLVEQAAADDDDTLSESSELRDARAIVYDIDSTVLSALH